MSDNDYKKVFSNNLKYYMNKRNKKQNDLINDLGLSSSTVSNWCTGEKLPRMDKVQILADYLHINKSDLLEEKSEKIKKDTYYFDDDIKEIAQFLYENPDYKALFDAAKNVKREDIEFVRKIIERIRSDWHNVFIKWFLCWKIQIKNNYTIITDEE